jgi:7-carboxy-7-deazaguanine synthase
MSGRAVELEVSELFVSLQGEGPNVGTPAFFVRLARCNLRCHWCDTGYAWDFGRHRFEEAVKVMEIGEVAKAVRHGHQPSVVITGGEPLLQQDSLVPFLAELGREVEVETNGTVLPRAELLGRVERWIVSPKLGSSGVPEGARFRPEALRALRESGRAWLKIVVLDETEAEEAERLVDATGWPRDKVCLMPRALTRAELRERSPVVARACLGRHFRFSTRLQLELWDGERGH